MARPLAPNRPLAAGLGFSLLVHVGAAMALAINVPGFWASPGPELQGADLPSPESPEPPRVRPGIERSKEVTINWLGFERPTPHEAALSTVDQAALNPETPGVPADAEAVPQPVTAVAAPPPAETPADAASPAPAPVEAAPVLASDRPAVESGALVAAEERVVVAPVIGPPLPPAEAAEASPEAPPPALPEPRPQPTPQAQPSEQPAPPSPPAPTPGVEASIESTKESPATSTRPPVEVSPGQPVAAEGLDIETVRPRWTLVTRMTALPRNPVVRVTFGRDGRVARAEFVPGRNTGYADVDGPLLDAVYRWRARGRALDELPAGVGGAEGEAAGITLEFRLVLGTRR
ncbi:MAG: hypothetical protein KIS87_13085 [Phycisphaeraceae bacterium]|nr:hypothetical protein [Phycisphaeraceae bacterium]